jgi:hypothetical protein
VYYRGQLAVSSLLPRECKELQIRSSFPSMNSVVCRLTSRVLLPLVLVMTLAVGASAEWKEKVLYSFQGLPNDGAYPAGGVVFDKAGNLYGATTQGGGSNCAVLQCGVVFQLKPPEQKGSAWTENVLYVFKGVSVNDGNSPLGGVVLDRAGNLYGTTGYGGSGGCELFGTRVGCGVVFELIPPKQKGGAWTEKILHNFEGGADGDLPWGDLTLDSAGDLYGATEYGGGYGSCNTPYYRYCGTVFKLSPPKTKSGKWTGQVLYAFKGVASGKQLGDGANPNGGLIFDSKGMIYGTTYFGGNNVKGTCAGGVGGTGCGTVFKLSPPGQYGGKWIETLIRRFDNQDGVSPAAGVVFGNDKRLYGSTAGGGGDQGGALFRLQPKSSGEWSETIIHTFIVNGAEGCCVSAPLLPDATTGFYGVASSGGDSESGLIFRIRASSNGNWNFEAGYYFTGFPDGGKPASGLVVDKAGKLYGTTQIGGTGTGCQYGGCGTVYEVSPSGFRRDFFVNSN